MELRFALVSLWRNKLVVAAGVVLAVAAGFLLSSRAVQANAGAVAWTRLIADSVCTAVEP